MPEGLFGLHEGCLCLLGLIIIVLQTFLTRYFEPVIVKYFSFRGSPQNSNNGSYVSLLNTCHGVTLGLVT
jgi:hypothetical protein